MARETNSNAIQILGLNSDGKKLVTNQANLEIVRQGLQDAEVSKLCIVSLTGSFRTGKSFMLSLMVRYLRHYEGRSLGSGTEWTHGTNLSGENEFRWRPGVDRHTTGIWMYPKPFVRVVRGVKIGVMLMDTQGLWDGSSGYSLLTSIFGMSSIISSVQIYNVMRTLELDKLDQIKWFTGFGSSAMRQCRDVRGGDGVAVTEAPTLQSLHLMVRDWVGFSKPSDADSCAAENRQFLPSQRSQSEFQKFVTQLERVYLSVDSVLLPPPGSDCCFNTSFRGDLEQVDGAFLSNTAAYFKRLFAQPTVKQFNGSAVTADGLVELITRFAAIFRESDVPDSLSFAGAMESTVNMCAREAAVTSYREFMMKAMTAGGSLDKTSFDHEHRRAHQRAVAGFERGATYGDEAGVRTERDKMLAMLETAKGDMLVRNEKLCRCALNDYAPYLAVALVAVLVDKLSDVTCDGWVSACDDISLMLARAYTYAILGLGLVVAKFAWHNGGVATMQCLVELGEVVRSMLGDWGATVVRKVAAK